MAKKKRAPKPNASYTLEPSPRRHVARILALDPGSRNMGISCLGFDKKDRIRVIANSILTYPIASLVDNYMDNRKLFMDELQQWLDLYKPDLIIAERFQTRGLGGPLIELVSTMNAVIGMMALKTPFKFITAATWKNAFHRRFAVALDDVYRGCRTAPHPLDATLIGCYGLELALGRPLRYGPVSIVRQAEQTSRLPLRKIKVKKD